MITLQQIADEIGVSRVVVSRVLNDRPIRVSDATRKQILELIDSYGYQPNALVKALHAKQTQALGVLMINVDYSFHSRLLGAIEQAVSSRGWQVMMCQTHRSTKSLENEINLLRQRRVDGMIIVPHSGCEALLRKVVEFGEKIVFVDDNSRVGIAPCFKSDDCFGARLAVEHLLKSGRDRIAFIGWPPGVSINGDERREGYMSALRDHGIEVRNELMEETLEEPVVIETGYHQTLRLLRSGVSFSALFAAMDQLAVGAITALREQGMRIPEDVAVVGYGNLREGHYMTPSLSTVEQKPEEIGKRAVEHLLGVLENKLPLLPTINCTVPELIIRCSSVHG